MDHIFAPWRIRYILGPKEEGCIFCRYQKENRDKENLLLYRGENNFVIMNRYPYNPGHLLIAPYRHVGDVTDLKPDELLDMMEQVRICEEIIRKVMEPDGFNIGINVGSVAGAGMEDHIHTHIVPRWDGDTSFMPVFGDVNVVPEALQETYDKLKPEFEKR
ncbi:MAG: HIT domain-containing protein [Archaeoglobaceae archaeon]